MERSLYWYIGSLHILNNTYSAALTNKQVARKVFSSLFNRAYFIITNKDDLTKENNRIKQVIKKNEHWESIISKIFKRITACLSHNNKCKTKIYTRKRSE